MQKYVSVNTPLEHLSAGRLSKKLYRRRVEEFPDEASALAWQASARQSIRLGREPDMESTTPAVTFKDIAALAVPVVFADNRDRAAINTNVAYLSRWFGAMPVDTITDQDLIQMADALHADGKAASTINHRLAKFNKIMAFAAQRGMVTKPPVYRHKGTSRQRERVFTRDECDRLIAGLYVHGSVYGQFATSLLWLGSRYGETVRLRWTDIEDDVVVFRSQVTKTNKARTIPIRCAVREALDQAWLERAHEPGPFSQLRTHKVFYTRWSAVKTDMGLANDADFTPHSLRHTCMTRLAQDGFTLPQLKSWGGWASYAMVARYEHIESAHDLRKALDSRAHNV